MLDSLAAVGRASPGWGPAGSPSHIWWGRVVWGRAGGGPARSAALWSWSPGGFRTRPGVCGGEGGSPSDLGGGQSKAVNNTTLYVTVTVTKQKKNKKRGEMVQRCDGPPSETAARNCLCRQNQREAFSCFLLWCYWTHHPIYCISCRVWLSSGFFDPLPSILKDFGGIFKRSWCVEKVKHLCQQNPHGGAKVAVCQHQPKRQGICFLCSLHPDAVRSSCTRLSRPEYTKEASETERMSSKFDKKAKP